MRVSHPALCAAASRSCLQCGSRTAGSATQRSRSGAAGGAVAGAEIRSDATCDSGHARDRAFIEEVHFGSTRKRRGRVWWDICGSGALRRTILPRCSIPSAPAVRLRDGQPLRLPEASVANSISSLCSEKREAIESKNVGGARELTVRLRRPHSACRFRFESTIDFAAPRAYASWMAQQPIRASRCGHNGSWSPSLGRSTTCVLEQWRAALPGKVIVAAPTVRPLRATERGGADALLAFPVPENAVVYHDELSQELAGHRVLLV